MQGWGNLGLKKRDAGPIFQCPDSKQQWLASKKAGKGE
jgi:hypothetical protein